MNSLIDNIEVKILDALNAMFMDLSCDQLTLYSTGDEQDWRKTNDLTQRFGLLNDGK